MMSVPACSIPYLPVLLAAALAVMLPPELDNGEALTRVSTARHLPGCQHFGYGSCVDKRNNRVVTLARICHNEVPREKAGYVTDMRHLAPRKEVQIVDTCVGSKCADLEAHDALCSQSKLEA